MKLIIVLIFAAVVVVQSRQIVIETKHNSVKHIVTNVKTDVREWWETAVFYQIYPRSFKDSNNDGIGDLQGILQKLDHLKDSGITAAWLSPIFKSPQVDQGYDISDYRTIDPDYGTQKDFLQLLEEAHKAGIKIILDFVPNHTSNKHQWFIDSENRVEGYEEYYTWHDGITDENGNRSPPNNWVLHECGLKIDNNKYYLNHLHHTYLNYRNNGNMSMEKNISIFGGPAWTWSEKRQQYYLNQFAPAQPDLNYRNVKVVKEMKDILTYWLDLGVDGFRIDAVPYLFEDESLTDEPKSGLPGYDSNDYEYLDHVYTKDLDETYDMVYQWRDHMDSYSKEKGGEPRIIMTEAYTTFENTLLYFGSEDGSRLGAHFTFNFDFISNLNINSTDDDIAKIIYRWEMIYTKITLHYNWVLGNHDNHRVATRLGLERIDLFNMLIAMLPGIGVTYNGEEIGMEDGEVTCEEGQDPSAIKDCNTFNETSRDFERTPYHWDKTTNAGFNEGAETWLPVSETYLETNLAMENVKGIESHFNLYKQLIEIRKEFKELKPVESWITARIGERSIEIARTAKDEDRFDLYNYILILNPNNMADNVTVMDDNLSNEKYKVIATSLNSAYKIGDIVPRQGIIMENYESIILTSISNK